jgi:FixJ family two-component response regulator
MRAGAVDMLAKPFTEEAFFRAVHASLEAGTANRDFHQKTDNRSSYACRRRSSATY